MKKRMLSLLLAVALVLGLCPSVFAAGSSYADVLDTHWAHPYIEDVTEKGIMNGVDDKNFAPEDAMTRAMFVTVLARLSGDTLTEQTSFSDVPAGQWYSAAVSWAAENGIVSGFGDGTFRPNDALTRAQAAVMLCAFAAFTQDDVTVRADLSAYSDAGQIPSWAMDAMQWANARQLIIGRDSAHLAPTAATTRAEMASILSAYIRK